MAVDLKILGKLLSLTRSHEAAEADLAMSRFITLLNRWRSEQQLPEGTGYVTLGEPDNAAVKLAEALATVCEVRVLALEPFELIAVGEEADCRWIFWWFHKAYPEIERVARQAAFRERHVFMHGAIMGVQRALEGCARSPRPEEVRRAEKPEPRVALDENGEPVAKEPPGPPPPLSRLQHSMMSTGMTFGAKLASRLLKQRPPLGGR